MIAMIQSFKDLQVYDRSYKTAIAMYRSVVRFPSEELYGLTSQIKRASTSIPLNIAEGYGKRENVNEFKRFLLMAIGSCNEMLVLIDISKDSGYIDSNQHEKMCNEYNEIAKMLVVLRKSWK